MTSAELYLVTPVSNMTCAEGVPVTCQQPEGLAESGIQSAYLILAVIPVWILCGNLLVILAVIRQRSLRTLSNLVIASLAFTDSLLALLVVPLGVYQLVGKVSKYSPTFHSYKTHSFIRIPASFFL